MEEILYLLQANTASKQASEIRNAWTRLHRTKWIEYLHGLRNNGTGRELVPRRHK